MKLKYTSSQKMVIPESNSPPEQPQEGYIDVDMYGRCSDKIFGKGAELETRKALLLELLARREEKSAASGGRFIEYDLYGRADPRIFGNDSHFLNSHNAKRALQQRKKDYGPGKSSLRALLFPAAEPGRLDTLLSKSSSGPLQKDISEEKNTLTNELVETVPLPEPAAESCQRAKCELPNEEPMPYIVPGRVARAVKSLDLEERYPEVTGSPTTKAKSEATRKLLLIHNVMTSPESDIDHKQTLTSMNENSTSPEASDIEASGSSSRKNSSSVDNTEESNINTANEEQTGLVDGFFASPEQPSQRNSSSSSIMQDQSVDFSPSMSLSPSRGCSVSGRHISHSSQAFLETSESSVDSSKRAQGEGSKRTLSESSEREQSEPTRGCSKVLVQTLGLESDQNAEFSTQESISTAAWGGKNSSNTSKSLSKSLSSERTSQSLGENSTEKDDTEMRESNVWGSVHRTGPEQASFRTVSSGYSRRSQSASGHTLRERTSDTRSQESQESSSSSSSNSSSDSKQIAVQHTSLDSESMLGERGCSSGSEQNTNSEESASNSSKAINSMTATLRGDSADIKSTTDRIGHIVSEDLARSDMQMGVSADAQSEQKTTDSRDSSERFQSDERFGEESHSCPENPQVESRASRRLGANVSKAQSTPRSEIGNSLANYCITTVPPQVISTAEIKRDESQSNPSKVYTTASDERKQSASSSETSSCSSAQSIAVEQPTVSLSSERTSGSDSTHSFLQNGDFRESHGRSGPAHTSSRSSRSHGISNPELANIPVPNFGHNAESRSTIESTVRGVESEGDVSSLAHVFEDETLRDNLVSSRGRGLEQSDIEQPSIQSNIRRATSFSKFASKGGSTRNSVLITDSRTHSVGSCGQVQFENNDEYVTEEALQDTFGAEGEEDDSYEDALDGDESNDGLVFDSDNSRAAPSSSEVMSTSEEHVDMSSGNVESSESYSCHSSGVPKASTNKGSNSTSFDNGVEVEGSVRTTNADERSSTTGSRNESVSAQGSSGQGTNAESKSIGSSSYSQVFESTVVEDESDDSDVFLMAMSGLPGVDERESEG